MAIDRDALRAWVAASCEAQGLEVLVSDPGVVARVGVLLGGREAARRPPAGGEHGFRQSQSPGGQNSARVESSASGVGGGDGRVVQHGADDGGLPGQVKRLPRLS